MDTRKPLILVTNDDGIFADGIHYLADFVADMGEVVVVAPDAPRSGSSSAITVEVPLRFRNHPDYHGMKMLSVNGTPADCVKLAHHAFTDRKPDLLLSGINHGANTGNSVINSGTIGAAIEGAILRIPSVGFSLISHTPTSADFERCRPYIRRIVESVMAKGLPEEVCLNVNIPAGEITGMSMAKSCKGTWTGEYKEYFDPAGRKFYMLTGKYVNLEADSRQTDLYHLSQGRISIVPISASRDHLGPTPDYAE